MPLAQSHNQAQFQHLANGLNETRKDLIRLESNSRRVLEGVVTRVEPFANQVNRIVLDNSRLKQEITWLYRELDFTTQKLLQQQQIINVMASHIGLDELVSFFEIDFKILILCMKLFVIS